ncbi:hypothetical protein D3C75_1121270 [compost metagenome]
MMKHAMQQSCFSRARWARNDNNAFWLSALINKDLPQTGIHTKIVQITVLFGRCHTNDALDRITPLRRAFLHPQANLLPDNSIVLLNVDIKRQRC